MDAVITVECRWMSRMIERYSLKFQRQTEVSKKYRTWHMFMLHANVFILKAARKSDEMLEPYEWKRSRTVLREEGGGNTADLLDYRPLIDALGGEVIEISATSPNHINAMDMGRYYGEVDPVIEKSQFLQSLCEQIISGHHFAKGQQSIIDRCTENVYREYKRGGYKGDPPTLVDFRDELLKQPEKEAQSLALELELFTRGTLNTFAKQTNVNTENRLICYDILELGEQLRAIGMLVILDSILNRITANRAKGRQTFVFVDEVYLLFMHEYSAQFLFKLWKRVRKYGAFCTGITQNCEDLLQSHTARTMLSNSEFILMLNQASTDRVELAKLLNISNEQVSYINGAKAGSGLIKVGNSLVPFENNFPNNTKLYRLMTTKLSEVSDNHSI